MPCFTTASAWCNTRSSKGTGQRCVIAKNFGLLLKPSSQMVLHSNNGSPMKGATILQALGVMPSFSRPSVSDDDAFSEPLIRTPKYQSIYPEKPFAYLCDARAWVEKFIYWYNHEHRHSGIRYETPIERQEFLNAEILARRHEVYQNAKQRNPERWSGNTRNWQPVDKVSLNPVDGKNQMMKDKIKEAALLIRRHLG